MSGSSLILLLLYVRSLSMCLQAQMSHILSSFHRRTMSQYHVPSNAYSVFFAINGLLLFLVPHLFALRCYLSPAFFRQPSDATSDCTEHLPQRVRRKSE